MPGKYSISIISKPVGRSQGHAPGTSAKPQFLQKTTVIYIYLLKQDWEGVMLQLFGPRVLQRNYILIVGCNTGTRYESKHRYSSRD
jgi:hypothetical protein